MTRYLFIALTSMAAMVVTTHGFAPIQNPTTTTTTSLDLFGDALKGAFSNDETLGKRKNEGLTGGPEYNENVTVNGQKVNGAVVGQKLTVVAGRARVKIPVNCQKGDCGRFTYRCCQKIRLLYSSRKDPNCFIRFHFQFLGTCIVNLNGKKVKACSTMLPKGKANIQTL
jgi:hypothetical protein